MSSGYRPPEREPQGAWARHIHAKRREWKWSQTHGFEEVRKHLPPEHSWSEKSRSAYLPYDVGTLPPPDWLIPALVAVYGEPPIESSHLDAPAEEPTLAAALSALAEELRASREAREASEARLRSVEAAVALLAQQGGVELPERLALRD